MESVLLPAGVVCMIAATVGGGLSAFGITIPVVSTLTRQALLFVLGLALCLVAVFGKSAPPSPHPTQPRVSPTPATPRDKIARSATPSSQQPARRPAIQYKLIWVNHFEPNKLYEVVRTDLSRREIRNDEFKKWCIPFDVSRWIVHESRLIAGDEHWKEDPTRLSGAPYHLPPMNERWFQIMDDEKWYLYAVEAK
jgi:hypothetical protein